MRPDPIAALAEAWGREFDAVRPVRMDLGGGCWAEAGVREPAETARQRTAWAAIKRARRATKRAEDERRTAEGRANAYPAPRSGYGYWDAPEGILAELAETTNWRIRSRERRANPALYMRDRGAL